MEITYFYKNKNPEQFIVAEFGVRIPEWSLNFSKMRLMKNGNGHFFISAPAYKYKNKEGKEVYKDYWYFDKDVSTRFKEKALELLKEYTEKNDKQDSNEPVTYTEDLF